MDEVFQMFRPLPRRSKDTLIFADRLGVNQCELIHDLIEKGILEKEEGGGRVRVIESEVDENFVVT